jgi:hypothetical protein
VTRERRTADHVARVVQRWIDRPQTDTDALIDAVHRLVREAELRMRQRCEHIASAAGKAADGHDVALEIRRATRRRR